VRSGRQPDHSGGVSFSAGAGAGALQPTEQAILRQTFPPKEQGMAMAVFGMAVIIGPGGGADSGGYIVDNHTVAVEFS